MLNQVVSKALTRPVRPFPNVEAGKWPVSVGGRNMPVGAPDGRELFFLSTVKLRSTSWSHRWKRGRRFVGRRLNGCSASAQSAQVSPSCPWGEGGYDIAPDGNRFLFRIQNALDDTSRRGGLLFVLNWHQKLLERVPVNSWLFNQAPRSARTRSPPRSAQAAWARCIRRGIRNWIVMSC